MRFLATAPEPSFTLELGFRHGDARSSGAPGAADGRKFQRYEFRITARAMIYPVAGSDDERPKLRSVKTRDLSRSGMCFLYSKSLAPGQRVDLELPDGRQFTLEVRRSNRIEDGWYVIGCSFAGQSKQA